MNRLIRFYNQNRKTIWVWVIAIIFIIAIIQILNNISIELNKQQANQSQNIVNNTEEKNYTRQNKAVLSDGGISDQEKQESASVVDDFLSHCIKGEIEEAYNLISNDCKKIFYPSLDAFRVQYYEEFFKGNKKYDFQLWSSVGAVVYQIKIHDDLLATGQVASIKNYKEDYYSVVEENNEVKLNINSFLGRVKRNKTNEKDNITIKVDSSDVYMDYEIYHLTITNNSDKNIILDTRENSDTTYVTTDSGANLEAMLFENYEEDLKIEAGETKNIDIKFSDSYQEGSGIYSVTFSRVVLDEENYLQNSDEYENYGVFEIEL